MIVYKSSDWWKARRHLGSSGIIRLLLNRVLLMGLYAALVTAGAAEFNHLIFTVDKQFFAFLGIMLSLLPAFRTNTAYDRFYEGRRLWGQLISSCRNLAVLLHARLPAHDRARRPYLTQPLSNFPTALDGHLRTGVKFDKLEVVEDGYVEQLRLASHVPTRIAAQPQAFYEKLLAEGLILPTHLITRQRTCRSKPGPWPTGRKAWCSSAGAGACLQHQLLFIRSGCHALVLLEQRLEVRQVIKPRP